MGLDIPELFIIGANLFVPVAGLLLVGFFILLAGNRAKRLGYASTREYLRRAPRARKIRCQP